VVLKNNRFANPFEVIGSFYSLPRYGTLDLTAFFGPFYMIFFGFCLGDAGYGLVLFLAGFFLRRKKGGAMKQIANLTFLCGGASIVFGFLVGSFFGVPLGGLSVFESLKDKFLTADNLFTLALALGVAQIAFALILKVVNTSIQFGFKYSLGTVGWLMVLPSVVMTIFGMLTPDAGIEVDFSKPLIYIPVIAGLVLMLFFHNPDNNPLKNVGSGLWNTYNDVTGFLGDFLSYIRLFALCLSGGTLAVVFNDLAVGLSPDIPVLKQVVAILILVFGHTINLAMSALGSFVHPMRLSFVEFYKNAGFESAPREFSPFRKTARQNENKIA
jgi:V/A-type H+-transporting ATPase subunit I